MTGRCVLRPVWAYAILLLTALGVSPAAAARFDQDAISAGVFLVAPRRSADPSFAEAVVLLVRLDETGALGLVINRPTTTRISRVFQDVKSARHLNNAVVFSGGPVEDEAALALYRSPRKIDEGSLVFQSTYLISTRPALERLLGSKTAEKDLRVYLGYTGWGPGQLEHELDLEVWRVLPAESDSVFDPDPSSVWPRLINRTELRMARLPTLLKTFAALTPLVRSGIYPAIRSEYGWR